MTSIRITAPVELPVDLRAAKLALRIDGDELDPQIKLWIKGIAADLEHETGQCLMEQEWEVRLPCFPGVEYWQLAAPAPRSMAVPIELPHPVMSVTEVAYIDATGADRVLAEGQFRLNKARYTSTLTPARGGSWPATAEDEAAVKIKVVCGYGSTPAATPEQLQLYILAKLREQFDGSDKPASPYTERLLDGYRSRG